MKKFTYLLFLAIGVTSCSVESMDSTENLLTADAKYKMAVATSVDHDENVCLGDMANFTFNFPQAYNSNDKEQKTLVILELLVNGEWVEIHQGNYDGAGPKNFSYDFGAVGTYQLQHRIGTGNNWTAISVNVEDCNPCEESFSYKANANGSYTFTYIPEEDMNNVDVEFTFAQGVVATGYKWDWNGKSSSRTETMNLTACEIYTWTVMLTPDCSGQSGKSNVWTDFKVDNLSKKNDDTPTIEKSC